MSTAVLERPKTRKRSARSLKREIKDILWFTDDPEILQDVLRFFRKKVPEFRKAPKELVKALEASDRSFAEGRGIPHEEVMKRIKKWLSEH